MPINSLAGNSPLELMQFNFTSFFSPIYRAPFSIISPQTLVLHLFLFSIKMPFFFGRNKMVCCQPSFWSFQLWFLGWWWSLFAWFFFFFCIWIFCTISHEIGAEFLIFYFSGTWFCEIYKSLGCNKAFLLAKCLALKKMTW